MNYPRGFEFPNNSKRKAEKISTRLKGQMDFPSGLELPNNTKIEQKDAI